MNRPAKTQRWWMLAFVGTIFLLTLAASMEFHIDERIAVPLIMVAALMFGTMAMWMRANGKATGAEWWQDDTSTGLHGY